MRTFILSVFSLFLLVSVNDSYAQNDDYWVKTNFPDTEVKLIFKVGPEQNIAISANNEIFEYDGNSYTKIEHSLESDITAGGGNLIGTNKGMYSISTFEKVDYFTDMNIVGILGDNSKMYVFTDTNLFYRSVYSTEGEWVKCSLPQDSLAIRSIAFASNKALAITISDELFISSDYGESWNKAVDAPEEQIFTVVAWEDYDSKFYVGTDKDLFYYNGELNKVDNYDGGYVSCITDLRFNITAVAENKKNRLQFSNFWQEELAVGTLDMGVYGVDSYNNRATQKIDSLVDLHITAISYQDNFPVFAGTKGHGIYKTQQYFKSVQELNLAPYALKFSPNPAKSRALISFHNPEYAEIEIAIYDLFGRKVADVHSGSLAEGDYNFSADLSGLASGSYFLRFGVGGRVGSLGLIVE